jgi:thiamine pyridinylase
MPSSQRPAGKVILWSILLTAVVLATLTFRQSDCKRVIRVGIYPFVPESAEIELQIAQQFEKGHPDVRLEFVDLGDYYNGGLLDTLNAKKVDVVEVDTVFLQDLVENKLIEPIPDNLRQSNTDFLPVASLAATLNGKMFGVPHWVCGNFLFFRRNDPDADRLRKLTKLSDLEEMLDHPAAEEKGLLADMCGKSTLGEIYLNSLIDDYGDVSGALAHLGDPTHLDTEAAKTPKRIVLLCPGGLNHNSKYHSNGQFYSRQFAHCKARAKISYSEDLYYVGDEFLHGVASNESGIGDPGDNAIEAIGAPLADHPHKMLAWVDIVCVRAGVPDKTKRDAVEFITEYTGEAFNKTLLRPKDGDAPRYLLPARSALYTDSDVVKTAPLYPRLKEIIQGAETATAANLNKRLQDIGKALNKDLDNIASANP